MENIKLPFHRVDHFLLAAGALGRSLVPVKITVKITRVLSPLVVRVAIINVLYGLGPVRYALCYTLCTDVRVSRRGRTYSLVPITYSITRSLTTVHSLAEGLCTLRTLEGSITYV